MERNQKELEEIVAKTCIKKISYLIALDENIDTIPFEQIGCDKCVGYNADCKDYSPKHKYERDLKNG